MSNGLKETRTVLEPKSGEAYQIQVDLPFGYHGGTRHYPLLLYLDADIMGGLCSDIPKLLSFEHAGARIITVGIAYGDLARWQTQRSNDFHPRGPISGDDCRARVHLDFLEYLLLTDLTHRYRIDKKKMHLFGHSSGGLFSLYALFRKPGLFHTVTASSPTLYAEQNWIQDYIAHRVGPEITGYLTLTWGAEEEVAESCAGLGRNLQNTDLPHLEITQKSFEGEDHTGVIAKAYTLGVRKILLST